MRRHSQVVRQRSAKPLSPSSNLGVAFLLFGVMVNQWQEINKMSKSVIDLLKQTTEGLFMPSESEYPFNVVYWEFF